jgi:hypothetical protein
MVDQDEMQKLMEKAIDAMFKKLGVPAQAIGQANAQTMQGLGQAKQWLTDLGEAGGKHVYILVDTQVGGNTPPSIVVLCVNPDAFEWRSTKRTCWTSLSTSYFMYSGTSDFSSSRQ